MRSLPELSNSPHGMNWSPASASAVGAAHPAPSSVDSVTMTSEFVVTEYGLRLGGVSLGLFRISDQTTARCDAFVGSAAMFPAAHVRKTLSWYVCLPSPMGSSAAPSITVATLTGALSDALLLGSSRTTS